MTDDKTHLVFRPKRRSAVWLLLVCGVFVACGLMMAQEKGWIGYLCAGFFALGIPVAVVKLLPGSTYLRLADDGLSFANMYRVTTIPWNAIDRFCVVEVKHHGATVHKMVGLNFVPSQKPAGWGRRLSAALAHCDGGLPDTYGQKAEELVEVLNHCLAQFKAGDDEPSSEREPPNAPSLE